MNPKQPPGTVTRLIKAAEHRGIRLMPFANTQTAVELGREITVHGLDVSDFALFFDKDIRLARALETIGVRVYNPADTIAVCDDKAATHLRLAAEGIPMPKTLVAPMTYVNMDELPSSAFIKLAAERLGFPMVIKECYGSLGGQVYLANNRSELKKLVSQMEAKPFICQEFVSASAGTDIRIYVVVGSRWPQCGAAPSDFRSNIGLGAEASAYTPPPKKKSSRSCCKILGALFAEWTFCQARRQAWSEVNSNAFTAAISNALASTCPGLLWTPSYLENASDKKKRQEKMS